MRELETIHILCLVLASFLATTKTWLQNPRLLDDRQCHNSLKQVRNNACTILVRKPYDIVKNLLTLYSLSTSFLLIEIILARR